MTPRSTKGLRRVLSVLAALGAVAGAGLVAGPAKADPKQYDALVGFGSDTLDQVTNAFAGFNNNTNYVPLQAGTGRQQLVSWDANPDNECRPFKIGAPLIHRPNGSSEGVRLLSHQLDNSSYGSAACSPKNVSGLIDFARSSSVPSTTTGNLTYIPFARDAVSFAYYKKDGSPVTTLTHAQLIEAYTNGSVVVGSTTIIPCGIQTGSGTHKFWIGTLAPVTATQENTSTTACNNLAGTGRLQENDSHGLKAKGDLAPANTQVIVGFSAANYIAKFNGVAADGIAANVALGGINDVGGVTTVDLPVPYTGTTTLVPSNAFYGNSTFGRLVAYVVSTQRLSLGGSLGLKAMFTNAGGPGGVAVICGTAAQATVNSFGFLSVPSECGTTTIKGDYDLGQPS